MGRETDTLIREMEKESPIFGFKGIEKSLKRGEKIEKIYISREFHEQSSQQEQIDKIKKINKIINSIKKEKIGIIPLLLSREELKEICKRPFNVSVIAFQKKTKGKKEEEKEE